MSYQERNIVASLSVTALFFAGYLAWVVTPLRAGAFTGEAGFVAVAGLTIKLIGASIAALVLVIMLLNFLFAIANKESKPARLVDERERQIEIAAERVGHYITFAAFVLCLLAAAWGVSPAWVLAMMTLGWGVGDTVAGVLRLIRHRRG